MEQAKYFVHSCFYYVIYNTVPKPFVNLKCCDHVFQKGMLNFNIPRSSLRFLNEALILRIETSAFY